MQTTNRAANRGRLALRIAGIVAAGLWAAAPAGGVAETEPASGEGAGAAPETQASPPAPEASAPAAAEASQGTVPRGVFTTAIVDREPTDRVETLGNGTHRIYYFTELDGLDGQAVTHRWMHDGEVKAEVEFVVGGPRWRVYSSKNLDPSWLGEWTVSVVDEKGNVLRQDRFVYTAEDTADEAGGDTGEAEPAAPVLDTP